MKTSSTSGVHTRAAEIVYIWALAEAFCVHPLLQEAMRYVLHANIPRISSSLLLHSMVLRREGMGPLAIADATKAIANEVVLLTGAPRGSYKVGSVRFANGMGVITHDGAFCRHCIHDEVRCIASQASRRAAC